MVQFVCHSTTWIDVGEPMQNCQLPVHQAGTVASSHTHTHIILMKTSHVRIHDHHQVIPKFGEGLHLVQLITTRIGHRATQKVQFSQFRMKVEELQGLSLSGHVLKPTVVELGSHTQWARDKSSRPKPMEFFGQCTEGYRGCIQNTAETEHLNMPVPVGKNHVQIHHMAGLRDLYEL